jgi:hypothetical protein
MIFASLGLKVPNVREELVFLDAFGIGGAIRTVRSPVLEGLPLDGHGAARWRVRFADTQAVLVERAPYDTELEALGAPLAPGSGHLAFHVDSTADVVRRLERTGAAPLLGPFTIAPTEFGPKRIVTFYRSPNGTMLETQEVVR